MMIKNDLSFNSFAVRFSVAFYLKKLILMVIIIVIIANTNRNLVCPRTYSKDFIHISLFNPHNSKYFHYTGVEIETQKSNFRAFA